MYFTKHSIFIFLDNVTLFRSYNRHAHPTPLTQPYTPQPTYPRKHIHKLILLLISHIQYFLGKDIISQVHLEQQVATTFLLTIQITLVAGT